MANEKREKVAVVYLYITYDERHQQTPLEVIKCLLGQLLSWLPIPPKNLDENRAYKLEWYRKYFLERSKGFSRVFIVLDALDEFDELTRSKLIKCLNEFLKCDKIKVFYTIRHGYQLALEQVESRKKMIESRERDVKFFIDATLENCDPDHELEWDD